MKTLKDLLLAMLNATLILVALCLFLLWQLSNSAERVAAAFADNLQIVRPLEDRVQGLQDEIAGLRTDIGAYAGAVGDQSDARRARIEQRMEQVETRMQDMQAALDKLAATPDRLMDTAIEASATHLAEAVNDLRGCTPAQTPSPETLPASG